jgi:phenylalanyl-tRNA synthetase alpha chain
MPDHLSPEQLRRDLDVRDLTDPKQGPHAIQLLVGLAVDALRSSWSADIRWCRGPRVVAVEDNYDNLLIGSEAASRDARYTRYVDERHMLRSHSSAMIPPALRALGLREYQDVVLICPGIVYRRDAIDWQHTGTPHQLDVWRISRSRNLETQDLEEMINLLGEALMPGRPRRSEPRRHPYTLEGRQVDIRREEQWIEVWECGLAHPEVLRRAGLEGSSGLALGMGLDRLLMLRKAIPDIRLLRTHDARVASQMNDLDPYGMVSTMPSVRRDLSIAVDWEMSAEDLGDRVRDALGPDADAVEEVAVLSQAGWEEIPATARSRLGLRPGQSNLLVRIVLRRLDRTLTDYEANLLRDRIYAALHEGTVYQWATR